MRKPEHTFPLHLSLTLLLLGLFFGASAWGADRLAGPIDTSRDQPLRGSVHPRVRPQADLGPLDPSTTISGVTLVFALTPDQQADLSVLLEGQADPASPSYQRWLTPDEYAQRFGMTESDLARVSRWLSSLGFKVEGPSRSRTRLSFSGTVAQLNAAFHAQMHRYASGGEVHFANATDLTLPADLAGMVLTVQHLNDFRPHARVISAPRSVPDFTSQDSGDIFLTPNDFETIYDVTPFYTAGYSGSGQTIAIVGQTEVEESDVAAFRAASGLSASNLNLTIVPGSGTGTYDPSQGSDDITESCLDIEWAGAIAENAMISFVYTGNNPNYGAFDSINYAIDENVAPIVSSSYGVCEALFGTPNDLNALRQILQQGNAQGQTLVAASGDSGAADCDAGYRAQAGLAVDVPAAVPEVTAVGGTELSEGGNTATYWNTTNNSLNGSAKGYIPEMIWNDTSSVGSLAASGGGTSLTFAKPTWQTGAYVPADGMRDVPDVALTASPAHHPYLICALGWCTGNPSDTTPNDGQGFRNVRGNLDTVGGTSCGAPSFAAILALVSQYTGVTGLGNVNRTLYALASTYPAAFHSVVTGNNIVPCQPTTPDCPIAAPYQFGFSATGGYSQGAGLGSVDAWALAQAWPGGASSVLLTVTLSGNGTGTVTGSGINCASGSSSGCSTSEMTGISITLTASPASGSVFSGWSGAGCTGVGTCTVSMTAVQTVTAEFIHSSSSSGGGCQTGGDGGLSAILSVVILSLWRGQPTSRWQRPLRWKTEPSRGSCQGTVNTRDGFATGSSPYCGES